MDMDQRAMFRSQALARILDDQELAFAYANKDCDAIAAIMSVGRTRSNGKMFGIGSITQAVGDLDAANALLDVIRSPDAKSPYRHIRVNIDEGRWEAGADQNQMPISMLPKVTNGAVSEAQAANIWNMGREPDPIPVLDVHKALYHLNGDPR